MSATVLTFPHLDAIRALPPGLLYPHQADGVAFLISKGRCQRRLKTPHNRRSKIPQFGRSGPRVGVTVFRRTAASAWQFDGHGRRDGGLGADVLRHQFGVLAKAVA